MPVTLFSSELIQIQFKTLGFLSASSSEACTSRDHFFSFLSASVDRARASTDHFFRVFFHPDFHGAA